MLALFVALGGSSYAAIQISGSSIKNGTITSKDLKNESVKGADVDNGTLTAGDVKNGSLLAADFQSGQLPAGAQGPAGPQGPPGATTVITRRAEETVPNTQTRERDVSCLAGERVVGGGGGITGLGAAVVESAPIETDLSRPENGEVSTGWSARGINGSGAPQTLNVFVLCASP
jgi:hypothetical protein